MWKHDTRRAECFHTISRKEFHAWGCTGCIKKIRQALNDAFVSNLIQTNLIHQLNSTQMRRITLLKFDRVELNSSRSHYPSGSDG